jgi:hypothetical protein
MKSKTKIIYKNKHLSPKIKNDEILFAITVADVQDIAINKLGRELNFEELHQVRKGIEWGFFDWELPIKVTIDELKIEP